MRWKTKEGPKIGDSRLRREFLFTPVDFTDGTTRWLEFWRRIEVFDGEDWRFSRENSAPCPVGAQLPRPFNVKITPISERTSLRPQRQRKDDKMKSKRRKNYDHGDYQWEMSNGNITTVCAMTPDELRDALCECLDLIDEMYSASLEIESIYNKFNRISK